MIFTKQQFFIFFLMIKVSFLYPEEKSFNIESVDTGLIYEQRIVLRSDNYQIGSISYTKIPLFPFYVIHSFYIFPQFRNNGYGKELLCYSCTILKGQGAKKIYIQPGPFELTKHKLIQPVTQQERQEKVQKLVHLYQKVGFEFTSKWASSFAYYFYKILRIDEDSQYLMVMNC